MNYRSGIILLIFVFFPINYLRASEDTCKPNFQITSDDHLEDGVKNYLACLKLVSNKLDQMAHKLEKAPPLQLATHSVNRAKFYNLYAKAINIYGKFQLEYMSYFMNNIQDSEKLSKSIFLLEFLKNNQIVQEIDSVSLSESQKCILTSSAKSISDYINTNLNQS